MRWSHLVASFSGGCFLADALSRLVAGGQGSPFQSPFAAPSGQGRSSENLNVARFERFHGGQ